MYELVIVWLTGETDIFTYNTEEEAQKAADGYKIAFGSQVEWTGTRRKRG